MTKEEAIKYLQQLYPKGGHCWLDEQRIEATGMIINALQEEPASEFLNTESMIESYKQRLISQANGVKNSPLINMCLASYKHGINDALDTLNLSNVQRTVKSCKEEDISEDLEEEIRRYMDNAPTRTDLGQRYKDISIVDLARHFTNWQKQQMMEDAMDGEIFDFWKEQGELEGQNLQIITDTPEGLKHGDKVKVIIIKED